MHHLSDLSPEFDPIPAALMEIALGSGGKVFFPATWVSMTCSPRGIVSVGLKSDAEEELQIGTERFAVHLPGRELLAHAGFLRSFAWRGSNPWQGFTLTPRQQNALAHRCQVRIDCLGLKRNRHFERLVISGEIETVRIGRTRHRPASATELLDLRPLSLHPGGGSPTGSGLSLH